MILVMIEILVKFDFDVIIVGSVMMVEVRVVLKKNVVLSKLIVVKKNWVYGNFQGMFFWDCYSVEEVLQVLWVVKKLYLDQF